MNQPIKHTKDILPIQKCLNGESICNLSDTELLAVILYTGTRNYDIFDLSSNLIKSYSGLSGIYNTGIREIAHKQGMGIKKSIRLHAAFEIGKRVLTRPQQYTHITNPASVWHVLLPEMAGLEKEEFWVLILNNKNHIIKKSQISIGTISEAIVHPREVFRDAIKEGGAAIIIVHNHPSGELTPSKEDLKTTVRLIEAGKILGISVLDHIIVSNTSFLSMKEEGYI